MIRLVLLLIIPLTFITGLTYFWANSILSTTPVPVTAVEQPTPTTHLPIPAPTPKPTFPPLTLATVFDSLTPENAVPKESLSTVTATGDVLLARTVNFKAVTKNDFSWAFAHTLPLLNEADLTFINLETPLVENCPLKNDGMIFCGDIRNVSGLVQAGIDAASLANNHGLNYGVDGVNQTVQQLELAGIPAIGVGEAVILERNGITYALLGYNEVGGPASGINWADPEKVKNDITQALEKADIVIPMFHWGNEYTTKITSNQRELAYIAVDAGAQLVLGNHSHWIQPVEIYNDSLIVYSHGNFIFDQMWSTETREGVVGTYYFYQNRLVDALFTPITIFDYGQPRLADPETTDKILKRMELESISGEE